MMIAFDLQLPDNRHQRGHKYSIQCDGQKFQLTVTESDSMSLSLTIIPFSHMISLWKWQDIPMQLPLWNIGTKPQLYFLSSSPDQVFLEKLTDLRTWPQDQNKTMTSKWKIPYGNRQIIIFLLQTSVRCRWQRSRIDNKSRRCLS